MPHTTRTHARPLLGILAAWLSAAVILPALFLCTAAGAKVLTTELVREQQSLLPYCSWLIDEAGTQSIDDISSGSSQKRFTPVAWGLPLKGGGPLWLRMVLVKNPEGSSPGGRINVKPRLVMNLGMLPPGSTKVFFSEYPAPVTTQGVWHSEYISSYEDILLPDPGNLPVSVYIRMDEAPGLWFAPEVRAQNFPAPDMLPPELLLPGILIAAAIVCLLRTLSERVLWPFWAMLFIVCLLVQSLLPMPGTSRPFTFSDLPALLAPGLSLMLLPHVARCMFVRPELSRLEKGVLFFCVLLGAAVALLPLVPGQAWLTRLFPLWPLLLAPLFPLCTGFFTARRPGTLPYSAVCIFGLIGAGLSLYGVKDPGLHPMISQAGLWGVTIGSLFLALARIPRQSPEQDENKNPGLALAESAVEDARAQGTVGMPLPGFGPQGQYEAGSSFETPASQPGSDQAFYEPLSAWPGQQYVSPAHSGQNSSLHMPAAGSGADHHTVEDEALEAVLDLNKAWATPPQEHGGAGEEQPQPWQQPMPELSLQAQEQQQYAQAPDQQASIPAEGQTDWPADAWTEPLAESAEQSQEAPGTEKWLSRMLPGFAGQSDSHQPPAATDARTISLLENDFAYSYPAPETEDYSAGSTLAARQRPAEKYVFNLHNLIREVHDSISPQAKSKGLMFSWFIAPSLPVLLEGDAPRLRGALALLLQNAVDATDEGQVQLFVRKIPGAQSQGDILFTISDTGSAQRTDAGFSHALELASSTGGTFNVDYSPGTGTLVTFTTRFSLPENEEAEAQYAGEYPSSGYFSGGRANSGDEDDDIIPVLQTKAEKAPPLVQPQQYIPQEAPATGQEGYAPDEALPQQTVSTYYESSSPAGDAASYAVMPESDPARPGDFYEQPPAYVEQPPASEGTYLTHLEPPAFDSPEAPIYQQYPENDSPASVPGQEETLPVNDDTVSPYAANDAWMVFADVAPLAASPAAIAWEPDVFAACDEQAQAEQTPPAPEAAAPAESNEEPEPVAEAPAEAAPKAAEAPPQEKRRSIVVMAKPVFSKVKKKFFPGKSAPKENPAEEPAPLIAPAPQEETPPVPEAQAEQLAEPAQMPPQGDESPPPTETESQQGAGQLPPDADEPDAGDAEASLPPETGPVTPEILYSPSEDGSAVMEEPDTISETEAGLGEAAAPDDAGSGFAPPHEAAQSPDSGEDTASLPEATVLDADPSQQEQPEENSQGQTLQEEEDPAKSAENESQHEECKDAMKEPAPESDTQDNAPSQPRSASPLAASLLAAREAGDSPPEPEEPKLESAPADMHIEKTPSPPEPEQDLPEVPAEGEPQEPPVIIAETTTSNRRLMEHYLADLRHRHLSPNNSAELLELYSGTAASLIIIDGDMPEHDVISTIRSLRKNEKDTSRAAAPILCLASRKEQEERLLDAGGTAMLLKPFTRTSFLDMVSALMAPADAGEPLPEAGTEAEAAPQPPVQEQTPPEQDIKRSPLAKSLLGISSDSDEHASPSASEEQTQSPAPDGGAQEPRQPDKKRPRLRVSAGEIIFSSGSPVGSGSQQTAAQVTVPPVSNMVSLPELDGESLDMAVMPLVPGLLHFLDNVYKEAVRGHDQDDEAKVQDASARLASRAEAFGLQRLGKIARCVERAAEARDQEALKALMEDMAPAMNNYTQSLRKAYEDFSVMKR